MPKTKWTTPGWCFCRLWLHIVHKKRRRRSKKNCSFETKAGSMHSKNGYTMHSLHSFSRFCNFVVALFPHQLFYGNGVNGVYVPPYHFTRKFYTAKKNEWMFIVKMRFLCCSFYFINNILFSRHISMRAGLFRFAYGSDCVRTASILRCFQFFVVQTEKKYSFGIQCGECMPKWSHHQPYHCVRTFK